jgi:hypothetical protein
VPGPDADADTLYRVQFSSDTSSLDYYLRCGPPVSDGCVFELDQIGYRLLAESNRGLGALELSVEAATADGQERGVSPSTELQFSGDDVSGAIYYWTTSDPPSIMRFDFGSRDVEPEVFIAGNDSRLDRGEPEKVGGNADNRRNCVGCHALSRDGTKLVGSIGGQDWGKLVYVADLSRELDDPNLFEQAGNGSLSNLIQFASFNPDGDEFVAIYGDLGSSHTSQPEYVDLYGAMSASEARNQLHFHDGNTGERLNARSLTLDYEPDHPAWSPDGSRIALTRVGTHTTSQMPFETGLELLSRDGDDWGPSQTLIEIDPTGRFVFYNPSWVPDASFVVFSRSECPGSAAGPDCNADADPSATTFAMLPEFGATPIWLERASSPGPLDEGRADLTDTFPRVSPFESAFAEGKVFWMTIASERQLGLHDLGHRQQLWMFAVDPARILAGEDGSFPAFHIPMQARGTRNHIAQWTERIVNRPPPPEPPAPPEPPVPTVQ